MNRLVPLATLVALFALALPAPTASAEAGLGAPGEQCVVMYVADYHWYYTCVDPKGGLCAVYTWEQHGVTKTPKECLVGTPVTSADAVQAEPVCIPTNGGGMDYHSEVCVDADSRTCIVRSRGGNDYGTWDDCYGTPF